MAATVMVRTGSRSMKVHVHLNHGASEARWGRMFDEGRMIGINERDPYGYRRAEPLVTSMTSSVEHDEGRFGKLARLGLRWALGFDLVHAWRNRAAINAADVVWTHTESQHLAISQLFAAQGGKREDRPKLLAQSVWLMDRWGGFSKLRQAYYRRLMRQADVLTFHSRLNLAMMEKEMPQTRCELVPFGINASEMHPPVRDTSNTPPRIIAVGNDVHRDWTTLIAAVARHPEWHLRIVSTKCAPALAAGVPNVEIAGVSTNPDLKALYASATLAIVPLMPNAHASGITALQEAALAGIPMVASDVGGLRDYFDDDAVAYHRSGDAEDLARVIGELLADPDRRYAQACAAQARMGPDGLSSMSFARRHVEISRELVNGA